MYLSFKTSSTSSIDMANINKSILSFFNKIYPLTYIYSEAISGKYLYLLYFILISVGIYELYKYFTVLYFDKLNSDLKAVTIINKYDQKRNKKKSIFGALLNKESKKFFSSSIYLLNTGIGPIFLTCVTILLVVSGPKEVGTMLQIPHMDKMISKYLPILFSLFASLSSTTYPSISLEGKTLWLLKSFPVKTKMIMLAKLTLNYLTTIPFIIINAIILALYLHLSIVSTLILIFTPVMYALFVAAFGLYLNIKMPDFDWTNEVKVIKQSLPAFITILVGMVLSVVPLSIDTKLSPNIYSFIIGIGMLLLNTIIYLLLFTDGKKKFELL
jgi:ABC-2 type transport system permease protein